MKIGTENAFPLLWPPSMKRTGGNDRRNARFRYTLAAARDEVVHELSLMGTSYCVLSSNLSLKRNGLPYGSQPNPRDPGVAVYFHVKTDKFAMACDRWTLVEDNMHAIGLSINALRGLERWGSGDMVRQAFSGFQYTALPPAGDDWRAVFGDLGTFDLIKVKFRSMAAKAHPDHGGSEHEMQRLNRAFENAKKEFGL